MPTFSLIFPPSFPSTYLSTSANCEDTISMQGKKCKSYLAFGLLQGGLKPMCDMRQVVGLWRLPTCTVVSARQAAGFRPRKPSQARGVGSRAGASPSSPAGRLYFCVPHKPSRRRENASPGWSSSLNCAGCLSF